MLFTDPVFIFYFLPATLLLLRIASLPNRFHLGARWLIIVATLVFYAYENWTWPILFLAVIGLTWVCSWAMNRAEKRWARSAWLTIGVGGALLILFCFKFCNWATHYFSLLQPLQLKLAKIFGDGNTIILPPGISFYVFEAISFSIDQYRRRFQLPPPLGYLNFLAMFPRFIAGPIVRYTDVERQLSEWPGMQFSRGLTIFSLGFIIKVMGADQFAIFVPYAFEATNPDAVQAWIGSVSYTFQLYLDFWGYSLMATGLGLCLGFSFPDNFRLPYRADSIGEFWRRWHITLSTWIRDYLYIPLGGGRVGLTRICVNLVIAMGLAGLWHGANVTFLIWGIYHGLLLAVERLVGKDRLAQLPRWFAVTITVLLIHFGWILFRSSNWEQARGVFAGLGGFNGISVTFNPELVLSNSFAFSLCLLGIVFVLRLEQRFVFDHPIADHEFGPLFKLLVLVGFILALLVNASSVKIPFLYFQF